MDLFPLQLSMVGYGLASAGYVLGLARPRMQAERLSALVLAAAFVLHTIFIVSRGFSEGILPVLTFIEGLAFSGWILVGAYLIAQARYQLVGLGAVVAPLAFLSTSAAALFSSAPTLLPEGVRSPWLAVHVTLAFTGNAVFALAFATSCIYLLQENLVKSRSRGGLIRHLPPLGRLDRMSHNFLITGFPLLTLGILSGGVWSAAVWGQFWTGEPREISAVVTWFLYAGLIQARLAGGLSGRRSARLTIFAFGLLLVSYLAVNLFGLPGRHGGGLGM
jgi:cytochrome c-type biogenesis protein CcsB